LIQRWTAAQAGAYGTAQHIYAQREIEENRLSDLVGTENCFGTADTISFRYNTLRIHDLKTGVVSGSVHQLEVYAALFCLEYDKDPFKIKIELRIYQDNEVKVYDADPEDIIFIMEKIQEFDRIITYRRLEEES
jgi:hypothetical protein